MLENNQKENLVLIEDLGMRYPTKTSKKKSRYGLYRCICGNEIELIIRNVKNKTTKSCGCYLKETKTTHGLTNHRLYKVWNSIIHRCNNSKNKRYKDYGGRGIKVCDRWLNIENFINDMYPSYEEGLSIDRIDVDGNYEPSNCRWATIAIQNRNTKKIRKNNTSGYRGVCLNNTVKKWVSRITLDGKSISLGYFDNALDAAKAYDQYVIDNNLEHTKNFN